MEEVAVSGRSGLPPPLPPKTRSKAMDSPPASVTGATVIIGPSPHVSSQDAFSFSFPEVQGSNRANHSQITTTTVHTNGGGHVVKIKINPENGEVKSANVSSSLVQLNSDDSEKQSEVNINTQSEVETITVPVGQPIDGCIRINVGSSETDQLNRDEMIQRNTSMSESFKTAVERPNPYFFYSSFPCATSTMVMSSGQCSPSDTLDSGTCSDLDSTPPPLPKKKSSGVTVTVIGAQHKRASSLTSSGAEVDSDDNDSNISCDSLNSSELNGITNEENKPMDKCPSPPALPDYVQDNNKANAFLPQGLLQDIRERSAKLSQPEIVSEVSQANGEQLTVETALQRPIEETCPAKVALASEPMQRPTLVNESTYEDRKIEEKQKSNEIIESSIVKNVNYKYEADKYYKFHLNENVIEEEKKEVAVKDTQEDELFAGYKDILGSNTSSTIRSAKGTVRGVKNRVRAGIATFLQINSTTKSYKEKDAGKVVVYSTTMGIVRGTYHQCVKVKQILRTHLVKFEERDVFMSSECQEEIRERMRCDQILVPQVFVDGQHVGDAETIERLNETGELRRILKPYKSADACTTCKACGGYRLLPCPVCNGSKKSVHRNHFTTEFVALKCMNCDEVGLVKCSSC